MTRSSPFPLSLVALFFAFGLLLWCGCVYTVPRGAGPAPVADHPVSVGVFYDALAPFGEWMLVDVHGWVWIPGGVEVGWRPYTHGRWVYTDSGWTWVSAWSWGWAPFHYGRWLLHPRYGWVWVPGTVWAPAWVAWRIGDGWIGWAPLPPPARWRVGVGLDLGGVHIDAAWWSLARGSVFLERDLRRHVVPGDQDPRAFARTREVTRYAEHRGDVVERGLAVEEVERVVRRAVPRRRLSVQEQPPERGTTVVEGERVRVYRPPAAERGRDGARRTRPPRKRP